MNANPMKGRTKFNENISKATILYQDGNYEEVKGANEIWSERVMRKKLEFHKCII